MTAWCQGQLRAVVRLVAAPVALLLLLPNPSAAQVHDHMEALGALPHNIPDFCAAATISSVRSGAWSDPATWSAGRAPAAGDIVSVAAGTDVSYGIVSDAAISCVGINGSLTFRTDIVTRLTVGTMMVMPGAQLTIGSPDTPVSASVTAEIVIANQAINTTNDPEQFGTGFLGFGVVKMHGAIRTPTWVRLGAEPRVGNTTLTLSAPVSGWSAGDRLILPDSRHLKWNEVSNWMRTSTQREELTVQSISADGRTITLTQALRFDHLGARDSSGALRLLPHVGNLTRNVVVRSQSPIGAAGVQGHVLFTDRADVDVRYTLFRDLGRTIAAPTGASNPIGRYPVHFHHLAGPEVTPANGYQYTFVGNAVDGGSTTHKKRWAVAIHNTHYGLVSDNVLYNYGGALLTTEDGSESFNVIERNFVTRSSGTGGRLGEGNEGMGFWFRGPNNYVRGNVAADFDSDQTEAAYGYKYFMRFLGNVNIPTGKGATTYTTVDGNALPILEFKNNEVYSSAQGLTYWWLSSLDPAPVANPRESVFEDLRIWHVFNVGVYHYPAARVRFERLLILGRDPASSACCGRGFHGEDYAATDVRIANSEIQGMITGVRPSAAGTGLQAIENSTLKNNVDVALRTMYSANGGGWLPPRKTVLTNVKLLGSRAIEMDWEVTAQSNTTQKDELLVYSYQGNATDNFRVYYDVQATQNVAGGLAPCYATRAEIAGIVCGIAAAPPPPPPSSCTYALSSTSGVAAAGGSAGSVGVTSGTGCNWTAGSNAAWITVTSGASGSGNGTVGFSVAANSSTAERIGTLTVAGQTYTITQPGVPCGYTVSPQQISVVAGGGNTTVTVGSTAGCGWTAASNATWITPANASGNGNGSVTFTIAANPNLAQRTAVMTVAGASVTVTQAAAAPAPACSYSVSPAQQSFGKSGGTGSVAVTTQAGCQWTATRSATWITITAGASGTGSGTIAYSVASNSASGSRQATITAGGQVVQITQAKTARSRQLDFNGDGIDDSVLFDPATGAWEIEVATTDGFARWSSGTWAPGTSVRAADFNADGLSDLLLYAAGTGTWTTLVNKGTPDFTVRQGGWPANARVFVVDLNGDSRSDVFTYVPATGAWSKWTTVNATPGSFTGAAGSWQAGLDLFAGNLNGDARADVLAYDAASGAWFKALNTTTASFEYVAGKTAWNPRLRLIMEDFGNSPW